MIPASQFDDVAAHLAEQTPAFRPIGLGHATCGHRAAREKDDSVKYANASFLELLIPILDNFELDLSAARPSNEASAILTGMDMVSRQLIDFLTQHGVEPINAERQKFDPNLHEAVAQEASTGVPEGHIVRQMRKGFKLRDRLLRPATVAVSKGSA